MVRVFYEPPPLGPGTDLNRSGYGVTGGGLSPTFKRMLEKISKQHFTPGILAGVGVAMVLAYIPVSKLLVTDKYACPH